MGTLETNSFESADPEGQRLDELYNWIATFVCENGPRLLTRGMSPIEAHEAIKACFEHLEKRIKRQERLLQGMM